MGRPVTQHLTPAQREGVADLYRETAQHEAWLRANTAVVRHMVYVGDAQQAIEVMRRNASEGRALMDIEAGSAWDEATGALRNAEHVYAREGRPVPAAEARLVASMRGEVATLLRQAGATLTSRRAEDAHEAEAYRQAQNSANAGRIRADWRLA
jgi:hypothetical protein